MWQWSVWICLLVVCFDMFICGSGLFVCAYGLWQWSVLICLYVAVVCSDMFMVCGSGLSGYVYDMWQWSVWIC